MAMVEINLKPSAKDLKWFGVILALFFGLVGTLVLWKAESMKAAIILWSIGVGLCAIYYAIQPFRKPMYVGWMTLLFPIGWTISHLVLAIVYYLVLTPIGLVMKLIGRDAMQRKFEPQARTYWIEHNPGGEASRYFRQF